MNLGIQHSGLKIDEIEWRGDENVWKNLSYHKYFFVTLRIHDLLSL